MAIQVNGTAPYAPAGTVRLIFDRMRGQGLPSTLTTESLQRVSVPASLTPRTLQTLKQLELIDETGRPTTELEDLRKAANAEFKPRLVNLLRSVYEPVFEVVDPASATYEQVQDAFRSFNPPGQRDRMVALFLGLLEYAEYSDTLPSRGSTSRSAGTTTRSTSKTPNATPRARTQPAPAPEPPPTGNQTGGGAGYRTTVKLGSAGTLTLIVDMDPWQLTGADRAFFNELVDRINEYVVETAANPE